MKLKNIVIALMAIGIVAYAWCIALGPTEGKTVYELEDLDGKMYAYCHEIVSEIPEYNYDVITVCADGRVMNIAGELEIHYLRGRHRLERIESGTDYGDRLKLYVPEGTVQMNPTICLR